MSLKLLFIISSFLLYCSSSYGGTALEDFLNGDSTADKEDLFPELRIEEKEADPEKLKIQKQEYRDCLFKNLKGVKSDYAAQLIDVACNGEAYK